ncbi:YfcL family protein [Ferrimonas gelatinilytica]|uniref:YfcL family protein n=1 Tax=Ferrimonas gelatinilytica TaxID=1255257 RepID=A0ABP9S3F3_9GAMM
MLERWDEICHQWVAQLLETGSDDEVFASGYLQGHFAVALSELEQNEAPQWADLKASLEQKLSAARSELAPSDLALIQAAWGQLAQRLQA